MKIKSACFLILSFWVLGCSKPAPVSLKQQPWIVSSHIDHLIADGYVELRQEGKTQKILFDVLMSQPQNIYLEAKQMGVLGLVYQYHQGISTVVLPREAKAIVTKTDQPFFGLRNIPIQAKTLLDVLMYNFDESFASGSWIQDHTGDPKLESKQGTLFTMDAETKRIKSVFFSAEGVHVWYEGFKESIGLPASVLIKYESEQVRWVWKQVQPKKIIDPSMFELSIPDHFELERK